MYIYTSKKNTYTAQAHRPQGRNCKVFSQGDQLKRGGHRRAEALPRPYSQVPGTYSQKKKVRDLVYSSFITTPVFASARHIFSKKIKK